MNIAILSSDARTARMLELEVKRCGFSPCACAEADVLLLDLDHPERAPRSQGGIRIGLSSTPALADPSLHACLSLPFSARELQGLLRTLAPFTPPHSAPHAHNARTPNGALPSFSPTEQRLLDCLLAHKGTVAPEEALAACVRECSNTANTLAVYIYRLRRKLGTTHIRRIRGKGYQWIEESR